MSDDSRATIWVYDAEVFRNANSCGFKEYARENFRHFLRAQFENGTVLDTMSGAMITFICDEIDAGSLFVGFNSFEYDDQVVAAMIEDKSTDEVFQLSGRIVNGVESVNPYANPIGWNRCDLFKLMNGFAGLKTLGIMMGHEKLQELPYHFAATLTAEQSDEILEYNKNDLLLTEKLLTQLSTELEMRQTLERDYQFASGDLTSTHDAGLASKIIEAEYLNAFGGKPTKPALNTDWKSMGYKLLHPDLVFNAPGLTRIREYMAKASFHYKLVEETKPAVNAKGKEETRVVKDMAGAKFGGDFRFKNVTYTIGVGGIHSKDAPGR